MKQTLVLLGALTGALFAAPVLAADLSYNYGNIAYLSESNSGNTGNGVTVDGSAAVGTNVNVLASYNSVAINNITINPLTFGVGYHMDLGGWDGLAQARYWSVSNSIGVSGSGYIVSIGGRVALNDNFELQGLVGTDSMKVGSLTGTGTRFEVNGVYHFNQQWGASLNYLDESNPQYKYSMWSVGARYNF